MTPPVPLLRRVLMRVSVALAVGVAVLAGAVPASADPTPNPTPNQAPVPPGSATPPPTPTTTSPPTANPTPNPQPTPSPPPATNVDTSDDPAWYDIPGQIRKGISDFFLWVASSGLTPVMDLLGRTVLSSSDLANNPRVLAVWGTCLAIANTCFVLFVVGAGFVVTARDTMQNRYGVKELLPRLIVGAVAANTSAIVCAKAIEATNALAAAIVGPGVDGPAAAAALMQNMSGANTPAGGFLLALMVLAAVAMAIVVVIMCFLRIAMLSVLVGVAPLALTCHALPQTEGLAYTWWRAFVAMLGIQLGEAVLLLATVKVFLTPSGLVIDGMPATVSGMVGVCVAIAMLWIMIKLPGWMKQFVLGPQRGRGLVGQVVRTVVAVKTLGYLAGASSSAGRAAGTARRAGPAGGGGAPGGGRPGGGGPRPSPRPGGPTGSMVQDLVVGVPADRNRLRAIRALATRERTWRDQPWPAERGPAPVHPEPSPPAPPIRPAAPESASRPAPNRTSSADRRPARVPTAPTMAARTSPPPTVR